MIIKNVSSGNSGLPYFSIEGIEKNRRNEKIITNFLTTLYNDEIFASETLNNWKGTTLEIRYARNSAELDDLFSGRKTDRMLPENHPERSLLY